ncbi:MAG: hypothetical protein M3198_07270 [Actinomycetota bacterium]|nr:hypothetical protein [Actinomycetota bacterium]
MNHEGPKAPGGWDDLAVAAERPIGGNRGGFDRGTKVHVSGVRMAPGSVGGPSS